MKDGKKKTYYLYQITDHQEAYKETGAQAVSYTTGVPAMIGASLVLKGLWDKPGVHNVEELDPDPFMEALNEFGLPWREDFDPDLVRKLSSVNYLSLNYLFERVIYVICVIKYEFGLEPSSSLRLRLFSKRRAAMPKTQPKAPHDPQNYFVLKRSEQRHGIFLFNR